MFEKTREYLNSLSKEELKETLLKLGFQVNLMYEDFIGHYTYIDEDEIYFGKIDNIPDLVTFQTNDINNVKEEFIKAVDDYIELCEEVGKEIIINNV